jgi:deazaflavin-dependent oxidoreductase (nitroreductase family)
MDNREKKAINRQVIEEYRANGGNVGGRWEGMSLLLLTTIGAKTGEPRTVPLGYQVFDGDVVLLASDIGAPVHPAWFINLSANPEVTVELPGETYRACAVIPTGAERDAWFTRAADDRPFFYDHQRKTSRIIPVVILKRLDETGVVRDRMVERQSAPR